MTCSLDLRRLRGGGGERDTTQDRWQREREREKERKGQIESTLKSGGERDMKQDSRERERGGGGKERQK